ncbi:RRXRR domain-containing protein [Nostoc sp. NMS8]|uniref:RRXRR domain-containing protein n=1 Tax=Nostoc sp. NMS8 TaxID=2815392 RepID=UPI0025FF044E|nr:RRXRR domain-containing protein [Nostoc sp. NMS8]MBN3958920.1 RRXRR domain-containing protein [Nostoc sp. NMS8]
MTKVFILDANQEPLYPVRISHARLLLSQGKATVFQRYPFTIILKESLSHLKLEQLGFKIHPGVKTTSTIINKDNKIGINVSRLPNRGI